ncbi:MAG: type II toxin-antitoxin system MqsA family antitoxin [Caldilineaceae bacterium]|nr:type II toxin-antitoxin system MqsA family antitoxin [Caldilineaceae bacterium]
MNMRTIRRRMGLTQEQFSAKYGFTLAAVRNWEQGRRRPERAARLLLKVIETHPEVVEDALAEGSREE